MYHISTADTQVADKHSKRTEVGANSVTPDSAYQTPYPPNLQNLPQDILLDILSHVHNLGPRHTQALAQTCRRLSTTVRAVTRHGDFALPIKLTRATCFPPCGVEISSSDRRGVTIRKTSTPGDAFVVFDRCVTGTSVYWQFRLNRFRGQRLDIGVALPHAFRFATVERKGSWSFDCFGRVSLAGKRRVYGRQMSEGDVVGILYDARGDNLCFLDNGVCMGVVPLVGVESGAHLFPFLYLPFVEGECVTLLEGSGAVSVSAMEESVRRWHRPKGLPYDRSIIVQTWEPKLWYAIRVDPTKTTLARLWELLEEKHGMAKHLFELIYEGTRLPCTHKLTLNDVGIIVNERTGTCRSDILLSVPHVVS